MATRVLMLLRHGKSDWDADFESDHERPLAPRGVKDATRVGRFLAEAGWVPELVLSSSAVRARTTVELAARAGGWESVVRIEPWLYGAVPEQVAAEVRRLPDECSTVMLAGHEPTCSETLALLAGGGRVRFPTAAVAALGLADAHWTGVRAGGAELLWLVVPRLLRTRPGADRRL